MNSAPSDFVETTEHRRFAEFCDACRRYRYIGLCYGSPGVGKTLSARSYANWDRVEAYWSHPHAAEMELAQVAGSQTVFYTPEVVNSPRRIEEDIWRLRQALYSILLTEFEQEEHMLQETMGNNRRAKRYLELHDVDGNDPLAKTFIEAGLTSQELSVVYRQKRSTASDPTTLVMIDEADRLKTATLEQVRDIFDQGGIGVVLIGMPGIEKRLSRYPQLYSRVGFVHAFRPLSEAQVRKLLQQKWVPSGVKLPKKGVADEEALAAIIRVTGGNFRLLHRLLTQIARLVEINALKMVTGEVVDAARESLVIGTA
jgi:DNA transposition AAA+ family ATPase